MALWKWLHSWRRHKMLVILAEGAIMIIPYTYPVCACDVIVRPRDAVHL